MIKNLKGKFVICLAVLIVFFAGLIQGYAPRTEPVNDSIYETNIVAIDKIGLEQQENYNWSFIVGGKLYGVNITNVSGIYESSYDAGAMEYTSFIMTQYLYNVTEELIAENNALKVQVNDLTTALNATAAALCAMPEITAC